MVLGWLGLGHGGRAILPVVGNVNVRAFPRVADPPRRNGLASPRATGARSSSPGSLLKQSRVGLVFYMKSRFSRRPHPKISTVGSSLAAQGSVLLSCIGFSLYLLLSPKKKKVDTYQMLTRLVPTRSYVPTCPLAFLYRV